MLVPFQLNKQSVKSKSKQKRKSWNGYFDSWLLLAELEAPLIMCCCVSLLVCLLGFVFKLPIFLLTRFLYFALLGSGSINFIFFARLCFVIRFLGNLESRWITAEFSIVAVQSHGELVWERKVCELWKEDGVEDSDAEDWNPILPGNPLHSLLYIWDLH